VRNARRLAQFHRINEDEMMQRTQFLLRGERSASDDRILTRMHHRDAHIGAADLSTTAAAFKPPTAMGRRREQLRDVRF
jgi:hypothetical protein